MVRVNPSPLGKLLARHSETALTEALADTRVVLAARTGGDFIVGVVLYTGIQTLPFGPKMRAMPAATLWEI